MKKHKHIWKTLIEYEQQYCYCEGPCQCGPGTALVIAKCTICGLVKELTYCTDIEATLNEEEQ